MSSPRDPRTTTLGIGKYRLKRRNGTGQAYHRFVQRAHVQQSHAM